jgi:hypothetical protein
MSRALVKSLVALLPIAVLLLGSSVLFIRRKGGCYLLQLIGTVFLFVVVLAHISEALPWFPWMGWGEDQSVGHYIDLVSAISGLTLFPLGYLLQSFQAIPR